MKLSDMDSRLASMDCGTDRPSQLPPEGITSMEYLSSLADLATRIVRQRISDLPESRGEWDMIRALLTQMVDGAEGKGARELLAQNGIRCIAKPSERDRFWFTIPGCSKPVHVVARPKVAPPPPWLWCPTRKHVGSSTEWRLWTRSWSSRHRRRLCEQRRSCPTKTKVSSAQR